MRYRIRRGRVALLIGIPLVVVLICVLLLISFAPSVRRFVRARLWNRDPVYAAQLAHQISDYDLPAGLREQRAMQIQNNRIVVIGPVDGSSGMLISFQEGPVSVEDPEYRRALEGAWSREVGDRQYDTQHVGTQDLTLRGVPATLSVREGHDEAGQKVRQLVGRFAGKNGQAFLVLVGRVDTWDQAQVEGFLRSMR